MKKKNKKLPVIIASAAVIAAVAVVVTIIVLNSGHRVIKVESFEGVVALVRDSKDTELIDGMSLKSEDIITTGVDGLIELLVDADKHILAQADTAFTIVASGNDKKGKLKIDLVYGTSLIEIENKLAEGSEVEVTTPNATLSVRGTTFETSYTEADNTTVVKVTDGVVNVASDTESVEVSAGQMATVKDDEIEVGQLPIAYNNVTSFAIRHMNSHDYSDIYVKELVGWTYNAVGKDSQKPDGYTNNGVEIGYWVMTEDEVNSILEMTEHAPEDYLDNDDRDMVICAAYDYGDNADDGTMGYVYFKELEDEIYLGIIVSDNGSGALVGTDVKTYLPLTNEEYYSYGFPLSDESVSGDSMEVVETEESIEDETSEKEIALGTMEIKTINSSQTIIVTYNADYYSHNGAYYNLRQEKIADFGNEYGLSEFSGGGKIELYESIDIQNFYSQVKEGCSERGTTMSEANVITLSGRDALVCEEYLDGQLIQTYVAVEEQDSLLAFIINSGDVYDEGDTVIEELEAFLIDMVIVE